MQQTRHTALCAAAEARNSLFINAHNAAAIAQQATARTRSPRNGGNALKLSPVAAATALIPSAVKNLIPTPLAPHRPHAAAVQQQQEPPQRVRPYLVPAVPQSNSDGYYSMVALKNGQIFMPFDENNGHYNEIADQPRDLDRDIYGDAKPLHG